MKKLEKPVALLQVFLCLKNCGEKFLWKVLDKMEGVLILFLQSGI